MKQTIMTYEKESAELQTQLDDLKATSAEKDTLIARYEAIVKESEGELILESMKYTYDINSLER